MKKSIKSIMVAVAACVLSVTFAAGCGPKIPTDIGGDGSGEASNWLDNMHRDENDFLQDDNVRPSRDPFVDETPEDDGETKTAYRFEAELAKFRGSSQNVDHFCTAHSTEFSPSFSGNVAICNPGSLTFNYIFNSDKAVRSTFIIGMATSGSDVKTLSSYMDITLNGRSVIDLSVPVDPAKGEAASGSSSSYFNMVTVESKISLAEGRNALEISAAANIDYFEIQTSAVIEDQTDSTVKDPASFINIVTVPTAESTGRISFDCHNNIVDGKEVICTKNDTRGRTLPALTDDIYTTQTLDNGSKTTLNIYGDDVTVVSSLKYSLTLQEGATFEDGATAGEVVEGTRPQLKYTLPEGKMFSHWEDSDGNNLGSVFVMPSKAITIKPVFIDAAAATTITLQGATLGGQSSVLGLPGNEVDLTGAEFSDRPDDTVFYYWYNVNNPKEYYSSNVITVPDSDITLAPAFDNAEYAESGKTMGKISIFPHNGYAEMIPGASQNPVGGYVRLTESSGVKGDEQAAYWGYVGNGEKREMGAVYHWTASTEGGTLNNGFYFTPLSPYQVVAANTYVITTTVQNQGDKEITLKLYQTNASGTPKPTATCSEALTLAPGETKDAIITISGFSNANIMTTVELLTDGITDLKIGMYQYIATTLYNLTLENATFKNGNTTGEAAPGTSPDLLYTVPEGKLFSHWADADGNNLGQKFVMPDKDITIHPVFVDAPKYYTLTLTEGATFADGSTSGTFLSGETPELLYTVPEGKLFSHWEDAEGNNLGETFEMPEKNITVKPVFVNANNVTVTLQGATLDGESVITAVAGSELDLSAAVIADIPEGKILKGWFDVNDRTKIYTESITVPKDAITLVPVFEADKMFYSDETNYDGKITATGNLFAGKESGCHAVIDNKTTGAVDSGNGYYEFGSVYRFNGGTAASPADKMEVGSYFLTQEMNGWHANVSNISKHTVTTTVENLGSEDVTLRFALITSSGNPNSQYGEETVTIKAGESVTFTFDVTYLHGSFMLNVMVKDHDVNEVYLGVYQYVSEAVVEDAE